MQIKGTKSTSFLTHVRNEVDLIPLACEDDKNIAFALLPNIIEGTQIFVY